MQLSRHAIRLVCAAAICAAGLLVLPDEAKASCRLETSSTGQVSDISILRFMQCTNNELAALRREIRDLRARLAKIEGVAAELPAVYQNVDGDVEEEPGRAIGRASFTISARSTGGVSALPIEQRVLEELCAQRGGCQMLLAFRQIGLFDSEPKGAVITGPCTFQYDADTGEWVTGAGCDPDGPRSGVDGDQRAALDAEGSFVAETSGACIFSESAAKRAIGGDGGFERDHARGFFLISLPARQVDGIRRYQCELVLD